MVWKLNPSTGTMYEYPIISPLMLTLLDDTSTVTAQATLGISAGFTNPMTTLGDIIYEDATPAANRLGGNTDAVKKVLTQTGTGAISAPPSWEVPDAVTVSAPLSITGQAIKLVNNAGTPKTVTAIDIGALASSDTKVPTSKAVKTSLQSIDYGHFGIKFTSTWKTDNAGTSSDHQITLPLYNGGTYNFIVKWGDSSQDTITAWNDAAVTHTYASIGTYMIYISGVINGWKFNCGGDCLKLLTISNWNPLLIGSSGTQFQGCSNMVCSAVDLLDVSAVTTIYGIFYVCSLFNQDISGWDVSKVTDMRYSFTSASVFNQDIGLWDVSNVTNMAHMFHDARVFNQDISAWDVSVVTSMYNMFTGAYAFNQDISSWDVSKVTTMSGMFNETRSFNKNIGGWNTSTVTDMYAMFYNTAFNQDISGWDISSVRNMEYMFLSAVLSTANYDALLIGWAAQSVQPNVPFHAGSSKYTAGGAAEAARTHLTGTHGWTITDGGSV